ncbi:hypothetical protein EG68_07098 [Paragonimus skrjabini miyazakii]|uniref:SHSP domain-containing protein n=1 Tax=Paragonimus skrjabini miyazakii TaxID=59628 RepID=A0A8S9Z011_9TREM|nr:hypothetical protein EG68_07098 [Paragonimus skrjabini miyazakii]
MVSHEFCDPVDYLKDVYERYGQEDIQVNTSEHGLAVHAKTSVEDETGIKTHEYVRTIYLPPSVDKDHFRIDMRDGNLTLEASVTTKLHSAVTFNRNHQLALKPISEAGALKPIGTVGATVIKDETTGREKLHMEVTIQPEFTADDPHVRLNANRMTVSGQKKYVEEIASSKGADVKEFTHSYEIPEAANRFSMNSQLYGNTSFVEAPLLDTSKFK